MTIRTYSKGFTLIELLVVMGILGIIITAAYSIFITHQRTAYVDEEVVDVQQNLRIAMDSMARDIRMAGFMISDNSGLVTIPNPAAGAINTNVPVGRYDNNAAAPLGQLQPLPAPNNVQSDSITLVMNSADGIYAKTTGEVETAVSPGTSITLPVDIAPFAVDETVAVYNTTENFNDRVPACTYKVTSVLTAAGSCGAFAPPCYQLEANGGTGLSVTYKKGDIIARITLGASPVSIQYSLVSGAECPSGPLCLKRTVNGANLPVIAMNIAGLQFRYLTDNPQSETDAPANLKNIRAVRVTMWGQTSETAALSGNQAKTREVSSVVKIRNRKNNM